MGTFLNFNMLKDYKTRVSSTYEIIKLTIEILNKQYKEVQNLIKEADEYASGEAFREIPPVETNITRKFINKMCVYVCVIAALVVFAGYALTPIDWDILIMK